MEANVQHSGLWRELKMGEKLEGGSNRLCALVERKQLRICRFFNSFQALIVYQAESEYI